MIKGILKDLVHNSLFFSDKFYKKQMKNVSFFCFYVTWLHNEDPKEGVL